MAPWAERVKPSRGSRSVGVLGGVNAQEADAELGAIRGESHEGIAVADGLHGGDEGPRDGGKSKRGDGESRNGVRGP